MIKGPTLPPNTGTCRLCLASRPLVNSHIIPNFQFKALKKTDGYFHILSPASEKKELKQ